jgi:hypothetical protein
MQPPPAVEPEAHSSQKLQEPAAFSAQEFSHERCSELAYALWQQRGCPEGSADEDWFEAERQMRNS